MWDGLPETTPGATADRQRGSGGAIGSDAAVRIGGREEGVFVAASLFVRKCVTGLGVLTSAGLLPLAGFPAHAAASAPTLTRMGEVDGAAISRSTSCRSPACCCSGITREAYARNLAVLAARRR